MRALRRIATLGLLIAACWLGRYQLAELAGRALVRDDAPAAGAADAVVLLGGDATHRAPHAADLYRADVAPLVLAVGGAHDASASQALRSARALSDAGLPRRAVVIDGEDARNTYHEAEVACALAADRGWERVVVVSSPYHTRRAGLIFSQACGDVLEILVSPSPYDDFDPARWWTDDKQTQRLRNEYLKLAYHLLRPLWLRLSGGSEPDPVVLSPPP